MADDDKPGLSREERRVGGEAKLAGMTPEQRSAWEAKRTEKREAKLAARSRMQAASDLKASSPQDDSLYNPIYLANLGIKPNIVIDIGVRNGTPSLYSAFPEAEFILVDPQREGLEAVRVRPSRFRYIQKALGSKPGILPMTDEGGKSTLLKRTSLTGGDRTERYDVEITTLDTLIDEYGLKGPMVIKIDTEGYELEVIKGLERHLDEVEMFICEASVRKRFENSYNFSDLVSDFRDKGFIFYNILNRTNPRPKFYDVIFLRREHILFS